MMDKGAIKVSQPTLSVKQPQKILGGSGRRKGESTWDTNTMTLEFSLPYGW
jgi:hypothetical protein